MGGETPITLGPRSLQGTPGLEITACGRYFMFRRGCLPTVFSLPRVRVRVDVFEGRHCAESTACAAEGFR
jgi:hypothetical protein